MLMASNIRLGWRKTPCPQVSRNIGADLELGCDATCSLGMLHTKTVPIFGGYPIEGYLDHLVEEASSSSGWTYRDSVLES